MPTRDNWISALALDALRGGLDRIAIRCERLRLREMSEAELSDLGLSRREATCEAMRPFWQGRRCQDDGYRMR